MQFNLLVDNKNPDNLSHYLVVTHFVLFQLAWFACVLGATNGWPWLGVAMTLIMLAWHLYQAQRVKPELLLILITLMIGATFDQALLSYHVIEYQHPGWISSVVPVWILALWLGFAMALNVNFRWLRNKPLIAILFGALGGPAAYYGASQFGALNFVSGNHGLLILAAGWALVTPMLMAISIRFDGFKS